MTDLISFYKKNEKSLAITLGILVCILLFIINPFVLENKARIVLSIAGLMISWWILDAMPLAAVALVPIVLFPLFNINSVKNVTGYYADSMIFLFMGGFFLALAIEKWNLHKRIALNIIRIMGTNGNRIILGFIISTGFLGLWLSNTATTMMMFPIAMSVISVMNENPPPGSNMKNFALVLMLCIAYASNFGLGTIISTPPNVAYVAYVHEKFGYTIGFSKWMLCFMPLTIVLMACLYFVTVKWLYPNHVKKSEASNQYIREEILKLGPTSIPEKRVLVIFLITVLLWIFKDVINQMQHSFQLDDTMIAIAGGLLLFMIPSGKHIDGNPLHLLEWKDTQRMAWGILILFGGGIALAKELENAKLMEQLGHYIASFSTSNVFIMILVITTISVFLSEIMSNLAQVIVMAPVVTSVAIFLKIDPLILGIPMALGASAASMLPMGTPPNAIVFASGHIHLRDMIKVGFVLNIISIIVITVFCYFLQPYIINLGK